MSSRRTKAIDDYERYGISADRMTENANNEQDFKSF